MTKQLKHELAPAARYARTIAVMARLLDQQDGLGIYGRNLLRAMLRLDPITRYVILLATPNAQRDFDEFDNAVTCVLRSSSKTLWDQVLVPIAARRHDADLIFHPKFSVPLVTGRPCVFVQQGSDWYVNPENYPWWDRLYIRTMLPVYTRSARLTLAISHDTLRDLAQYAHIDVSGSIVTYAGVAENFSEHRDPAALDRFRRDYALPERFILTVARVLHAHRRARSYPGGNNERLLRAFLRYRAAGGDLPLVVVGHRIEEYLRRAGFSDADLQHVIFTGFIPNERLHLAYQLAVCFVLATLCESFGIPIVEALACGCPAIVPSTCASPEIAGGAAWLVDPRDESEIAMALAEVTSSESLRMQMRERGLNRAKVFTWENTARRTLAALEQVAPLRTEAPASTAQQQAAGRSP